MSERDWEVEMRIKIFQRLSKSQGSSYQNFL